jgi:hypothetical protein
MTLSDARGDAGGSKMFQNFNTCFFFRMALQLTLLLCLDRLNLSITILRLGLLYLTGPLHPPPPIKKWLFEAGLVRLVRIVKLIRIVRLVKFIIYISRDS